MESIQSEPTRCAKCERLVFESGGHLASCPDRPVFAKSGSTVEMFGGSEYPALHRSRFTDLSNGQG